MVALDFLIRGAFLLAWSPSLRTLFISFLVSLVILLDSLFEGGFGVEVIDLGPGGVLFVIAAWAFWAYIIVYLRMLDSSLCCPPVFFLLVEGSY